MMIPCVFLTIRERLSLLLVCVVGLVDERVNCALLSAANYEYTVLPDLFIHRGASFGFDSVARSRRKSWRCMDIRAPASTLSCFLSKKSRLNGRSNVLACVRLGAARPRRVMHAADPLQIHVPYPNALCCVVQSPGTLCYVNENLPLFLFSARLLSILF